MNQFFKENKKLIQKELREYLKEKEKELSSINPLGKDFIERLLNFTIQGKMIRGGLILLSYRMFSKTYTKSVVRTAAAIEIIHSSLLIHDDIMDRDSLRRGGKSIFYQYKELGEERDTTDAYHFGESLGICAGDIGFNLGVEILASLKINPKRRGRIISLWSKELAAVGLAQMQDIYLSTSPEDTGEEEILQLYRFKTARYTFSVPLSTGAILAGRDQKDIQLLERIGEYLGLIFQIKDDEIGIFGREEEIGKPVGTDLKEGKKTLYYIYLMEAICNPVGVGSTSGSGEIDPEILDKEEKKRLISVLKSREVSEASLLSLREAAVKCGVHERVQRKMRDLSREVKHLIMELDVHEKYKNSLLHILQHNLRREF